MHDETLHNDVLFDRLVDGELTAIERRQLLQSLDQRPDGWRRCALAFLEAQSWSENFRRLARSSPSANTESKPPASPVGQLRKSPWLSGIQWLALAASLLLAFGLGLMHPDLAVRPAGSSSSVEHQFATISPPRATAPPNAGKAHDALTLFVRDEAGQKRPVRIPLVDARTLDEQLGVQFQSGLPDAVRERLKDSGYAVQSKRRYAPLWLENGQPMIVPVEDTKIVPVSDNVYKSMNL